MSDENGRKLKEYQGVWVIADHLNGKLAESTLELITQARILADVRKTGLSVVIAGHGIEEAARELSHYGADSVIYSDSPMFARFREEALAEGYVGLIRKYKPEIVLGSATGQGRSLIPRIAVKCQTGLTADCTSLDIDEETGLLFQTRPAFGGNLIATIKTAEHRPQMATVRPHVFRKAPRDETSESPLIREEIELSSRVDGFKKVLSESVRSTGSGTFANSHIIITGGRGIRGREGFDLLREFAELTGAALGATRAAVDLGWVPYEHQIGQTGLTVRSKIYIACGVSGQVQHLVGMQNCECIVSINIDENAPIMALSDIAIVGDLFEVVPEMIKFIKREKGITE